MDQKKYLFGLIIFLWLGILGLIMARYGLVFLMGDEMIVPTQGFDPRDMFRGEYVRLGYQFSEWEIHGETNFFQSQRVYVVPLLSGNRMIGIQHLTTDRPSNGMYVQARIASIRDPGSGAYSYTVEWDNSGTVRRDLYDSWYGSSLMSGHRVSLRVCDRGSGPFIETLERNGDRNTDNACRIVWGTIVGRSRQPIRITLAYSPDRYFVQVGSGRVREDRLRDGSVDAVWRVWRGQAVLDRLEIRE